jgi:hypothetical protein
MTSTSSPMLLDDVVDGPPVESTSSSSSISSNARHLTPPSTSASIPETIVGASATRSPLAVTTAPMTSTHRTPFTRIATSTDAESAYQSFLAHVARESLAVAVASLTIPREIWGLATLANRHEGQAASGSMIVQALLVVHFRLVQIVGAMRAANYSTAAPLTKPEAAEYRHHVSEVSLLTVDHVDHAEHDDGEEEKKQSDEDTSTPTLVSLLRILNEPTACDSVERSGTSTYVHIMPMNSIVRVLTEGCMHDGCCVSIYL